MNLKDEGAPSKAGGVSELRAKVEKVAKHLDPRMIQKGFMRVYSRNENGDLDKDLIPKAINNDFPINVAFEKPLKQPLL